MKNGIKNMSFLHCSCLKTWQGAQTENKKLCCNNFVFSAYTATRFPADFLGVV